MDLSSNKDPFLTERANASSKAIRELVDRLFEYRDSTEVEVFAKYIEAKRDLYVLDALKVKPGTTSTVEIALIQGKIKAIGEVIAELNFEFGKMLQKAKKPAKTKKVRSRRQRKPREAGPAI